MPDSWETAQKILSYVARVEQRFGVGHTTVLADGTVPAGDGSAGNVAEAPLADLPSMPIVIPSCPASGCRSHALSAERTTDQAGYA